MARSFNFFTRYQSQVDRFLQQETQEPSYSWGIRMAMVAVVPMLWGIATGHVEAAEWITLTAEATCWVELKGAAPMRYRTLLVAGLLAMGSGAVGLITAPFLLWSVIAALGAGFLSAVFKNLGNRGSSLGITISIVFLLANAHPVSSFSGFQDRMLLFAIGVLWNIVTGAVFTFFIRSHQPYRASVSAVWYAISDQLSVIADMPAGAIPMPGLRDRYLKEREVRRRLDLSLDLFDGLAGDPAETEKTTNALALLRKTAGVAGAAAGGLDEQTALLRSTLQAGDTGESYRRLVQRLAHAAHLCGTLIFSQRAEDRMLLQNRLERALQAIAALKAACSSTSTPQHAVLVTAGRLVRLMAQNLRMDAPAARHSGYAAYSSLKISLVLHPRYWWRHAAGLVRISGHVFRYAARTAIAAALGVLAYKALHIPNGVWLPFTILIVAQPYFGATLRKSLDRITGTIGGSLVGAVLLMAPSGLLIKEAALVISSVLMVRYVRTRYSIATFFITVNLMLTFSVAAVLSPQLLLLRIAATTGGAAIALLAGFLLLPAWEKKYLPRHIAGALAASWAYYLHTAADAYDGKRWLQFKREAERANALAFDSYSRYTQEAGMRHQSMQDTYYRLLMHALRINHLINTFNMELEYERNIRDDASLAAAIHTINRQVCAAWASAGPYLLDMDPHLKQPDDKAPEFLLRKNEMPSAAALALLQELEAELAAMMPSLHEASGQQSVTSAHQHPAAPPATLP